MIANKNAKLEKKRLKEEEAARLRLSETTITDTGEAPTITAFESVGIGASTDAKTVDQGKDDMEVDSSTCGGRDYSQLAPTNVLNECLVSGDGVQTQDDQTEIDPTQKAARTDGRSPAAIARSSSLRTWRIM